jgi:hypothetical protein
MKRVDLGKIEGDRSFRVKMEIYLYRDAKTIMEFGKGNRKKLEEYMEDRLRVIEEILNLSRPFKIVDGKDELLEVGKRDL